MTEDSNINTSTEQIEVLTLEQQGLVDPPRDASKTGPQPKKLVAVEAFGYQVGRGLNKRVINPDDVYKLAAMGSSTMEIARWFNIPEQTIRYNFSDVIANGREDLKQALRQAQIKLALSGNATLLIWLGKQILGQQENPTSNEENAPLPWSDSDDDEDDTPV
jgi:hypothetical protein